jgi:OMF family outer membrane factor
LNPEDPAGAAIRRSIPLAPAVRGNRPKSNSSVLPPAATQLPASELDLAAPRSLALPVKPDQVRIRELRPLGLPEVETLAEVNNPNLKALGSRVEQAQSALRAAIARWYPTLTFTARNFPVYTAGEQFTGGRPPSFQSSLTRTSIQQMDTQLQLSWALIDPARTPAIAAARDRYEKAKNEYLIGLRELRLQVAEAYFDLQKADEQVRIGQESVRASLVSLRDARARFQAGVATKLEVLEAETQLARDQQLLTNALLGLSNTGTGQAVARRNLAALLDLPQDVTPTAKDPSRPVGVWLPSLQESIVAAYTFREELDQLLLDVSIANSTANLALADVQPLMRIFNSLSGGRSYGYAALPVDQSSAEVEGWSIDNSIGLNFSWTLFDGGRARAEYRLNKQRAQENRFLFAEKRDQIRREVETNWYTLEQNNRNITTTSREVLSARESLRLARLRFQAGVTTQREVVDTQRDLTQAEVRWSNAIADYNISLARLRRFTGLDQIAICPRPNLPAARPASEASSQVPVEPNPLLPACSAESTPKPTR